MAQDVAVKGKADTVRAALEKLKPQLQLALPQHITADRLLRVAMTAVQNVPKLLECDRTSLFSAIMTSAQLGLEPDGVLGQAYLVPFKNKVQFIVGYKGYLTLVRNSGEVSSIQAHEVCENDEFRYSYGINEELHHVPAQGDRGDITHFYCYAKFKDGGHVFEVLTNAEVISIRDKSEGYRAFKAGRIQSTPWESHYVQMGRKTAIRRLANYLPLSVQRAAALDSAYDRGLHASGAEFGQVVIEGAAEDVDTTTQAAAPTRKLDALAGPADEPAAPAAQASNDDKPNYPGDGYIQQCIDSINSKRARHTVEEEYLRLVTEIKKNNLDVPPALKTAYDEKVASFAAPSKKQEPSQPSQSDQKTTNSDQKSSQSEPPAAQAQGNGNAPPDPANVADWNVDQVIDAIKMATTEDEATGVLDLGRQLPQADREAIYAAYTDHVKKLITQDESASVFQD